MNQRAKVMAFYHPDGLVAAWKQAMKFAGKGGRIATLPEIIEARLNTAPKRLPWNTYFTTSSAEYMGKGKDGRYKIIVAHGIGPMSTLDGILKAYSNEFKDKTRSSRGGRISRQEFLDLESGKYGPVETIDYIDYIYSYEFPFMEHLTSNQAIFDDLLVEARLGKMSTSYLLKHEELAKKYHLENGNGTVEDPFIISMQDAGNCAYPPIEYLREDVVFAHLLSIGRLEKIRLSGSTYPHYPHLACEVSCHEWWNGTRFAAIQDDGFIGDIHPGIGDVYEFINKHRDALFVPVENKTQIGLRIIVQVGKQWFTQYPKMGERMDTGEPQYLITDLKEVGEPVEFQTTTGGCDFFFKYGLNEVKKIAPPEARVYETIGNVETIYVGGNPKFHKVLIQFYNANIDTTKQMIRIDEVYNSDIVLEILKTEML